MKLIDLERRLARIEATRSSAPPTAILTDRAIGDPVAGLEEADALANWRAWVAQGRATISNDVLCITRPEMTPEVWAEQYVTAHSLRAVTDPRRQ